METIDTAFDLNLLRVLVALAAARNVTQAAHALDMSQSGFSTALARLRRRFDDRLFVRTAEGMVPTPRAARMIATAQEVLARVADGVLQQPGFDPATARTEFRLAMADVAEIVFLPRLLKHLQKVAPHASVSCVSLSPALLKQAMAAGEVDLALGYFPDLDSQASFQQSLYSHTYACMVRRGHRLVGKGLTEKSYAEHGHAVVASPARSNELFDRFLEKRAIKRRVVLQTPHHLSLPAIIESTDLLATVPLATGARFVQLGTVELIRLPFEPPSFSVQQHWHPLVHKDPRSRWLRLQIADLFSADFDEWRGVEAALYGASFRKVQSATAKRSLRSG